MSDQGANAQTEAEAKMAGIIVAALEIDDMEAHEVKPLTALFDPDDADSLGLDSIDALEISLAIDQHYDVQLEAENEDNKEIFFSLRSLTNYVLAQADG